MAANVRTEDQKRQDRATVAEMYLSGNTQQQIADHLGLSQQQISYDLKAVRKEWRESSIRDFDKAKSLELEKIDLTEAEAWEAYHRSKQDRQRTVKEKSEGDASGRSKAQITTEKTDGDPRFLNVVLSCIDRRCKILGVDAPVKTEGKVAHSGLGFDEVLKIVQGRGDDDRAGAGDTEVQ